MENADNGNTGDTKESIAALGANLTASQVADANARPAPADAITQQLSSHEGAIASLFERMGEIETALTAPPHDAAPHTPSATTERFFALEHRVHNLITMLHQHFGGKITLPAVPPKQ